MSQNKMNQQYLTLKSSWFMKFKLFTCMLLVILLVTSCGKDSEQDGSTPTPPSGRDEITLTVPELILPDSDPVGTLSFSASSDWSVSLSETKAVPDWLTVEPMSGKAGQATLTVTAQPNENYDDRSAVITIRSGTTSKSLPVYQKKKNALLLSKERYELSGEETDIDVEVKSNIDFEVKILDDWITQVQTKGLTTHQLKFHIAANELPDNREGRIVIKSKNSDLADTVHVYQSQQNSLVEPAGIFSFGRGGNDRCGVEIECGFYRPDAKCGLDRRGADQIVTNVQVPIPDFTERNVRWSRSADRVQR